MLMLPLFFTHAKQGPVNPFGNPSRRGDIKDDTGKRQDEDRDKQGKTDKTFPAELFFGTLCLIQCSLLEWIQ